MYLGEGRFELSVLDEVDVGRPQPLMVRNGVQVAVLAVIIIPQTGVVPALVKEELHFIFLHLILQKKSKLHHFILLNK